MNVFRPEAHLAVAPVIGRRICVVGTSGSGKTYVARELARRLGLTYICNDAIIWRADWQPSPPEERLRALDRATREQGWTFDGNLGTDPQDQLVLGRCDSIVWLDLPRWQVWSQVTLRTLRGVITREPLWHGNVESWRILFSRDSIVWWSIKTYGLRRRQYSALFASPANSGRALVRLRSRREVNAWLRGVRRAESGFRAAADAGEGEGAVSGREQTSGGAMGGP